MVAAAMIIFYTSLSHKSISLQDDLEVNLIAETTCGTPDEHFSDICFIVQTQFFQGNSESPKGSKILTHIIAAAIFILSAGFALPVLQLFHM